METHITQRKILSDTQIKGMNQNTKLCTLVLSRSFTDLRVIGMLIFFVFIGSFLGSCDKADQDLDPDEYYVKYEVNSTTIYSGGKLDVTINTENNQPMSMSINQRKLSEIVIGPVQKGFRASMKVVASGNSHDKLKLYTSIYVSKNGSPFALKKNDGSDEPRDSVEIDYTIDY